MRELVLQLAVRGTLIRQELGDRPAAEELAAVRRQKQLPESRAPSILEDAAELPFDVPETWCWARVEDVAESRLGKMLDAAKNRGDQHRYLRNTNVHWFRFELDAIKTMPLAPSEVEDFRVTSGDVLICEGGHGIARAAVWDEQLPGMTFQKALHRVRPFACRDPHFFTFCLRVYEFEGVLQLYYTGAGIPHFTGRSLAKVLFPLPPLAEQERIVAKVDELMALCDRLEAQQQERAAKHADLARAALARFAEEPTPASLGLLFHDAYSIDPPELRRSIVALAVRGLLVPQVAGEGSAIDLATTIERARSPTKAKRHPPVDDHDAFYSIPPHWIWTQLGAIALCSDSGWSSQCQSSPRHGNDWGVLKVGAVTWGTYQPSENKALQAGAASKPECEVHAGDFLLSRANTAELVARSVVVESTPPRLMMSDKIVRFTFSDDVDVRFVNLANSSDEARGYYARNASGTSNSMKNVGRDVMCNLPIPMPPLAEQRRIVARVDQLMALVDRLEVQLAESRAVAERLMEAVVAELTRPPLDRDEPPAVEEKPDPAAARIATAGRFACYVVRRLHDDPEFGRTKLEKCNHLAESHCGVPLDRHAIRGAHGPVDYALLKDAERWADEQGGFTTDDPGDGGRVTYTPGPTLAEQVAAAEAWLGERKAQVDRLLDFLRPLKTRDCEVLATVYAAWNDLLLAGETPNDRDILCDAKHHWHEKKESISDEQWFRALRRLESHDFRPKGTGRPVPRRA